MTYLLDVNVLIALIDPQHVHHHLARDWFSAEGHRSWATCPLVENDLLRIVGHPRYVNFGGFPYQPGEFKGGKLATFDGKFPRQVVLDGLDSVHLIAG